MSKNKYLEIYEDIFPGNEDNHELKIITSYNLNWLTCGAYDYTSDINYVKESIINLIDAEYVIFPTNKFFHFHFFGNRPPDFKHSSSVLNGVKFLVC